MADAVVEHWDVLAVVVNALLHFSIGVEYAYPVVFLTASVVSLDRDLEIHEFTGAVYMLRHACGAVHIDSVSSYVIGAFIGGMALWSRTSSYLAHHHVLRRGCVLMSTAAGMLVLHGGQDHAAVSVLRMALYVATTRYDINVAGADPWDACAHSQWLLVVPWLALVFVVLHPRAPRRCIEIPSWYSDTHVV
jgi:hypothetical protein